MEGALGAVHARIGDQDLQSAELRDGLFDHALDLVRHRDVGWRRQDLRRLARDLGEPFSGVVELLRSPSAQHDGRALLDEGPCDGESEALAPAGDQRPLAGESHAALPTAK